MLLQPLARHPLAYLTPSWWARAVGAGTPRLGIKVCCIPICCRSCGRCSAGVGVACGVTALAWRILCRANHFALDLATTRRQVLCAERRKSAHRQGRHQEGRQREHHDDALHLLCLLYLHPPNAYEAQGTLDRM